MFFSRKLQVLDLIELRTCNFQLATKTQNAKENAIIIAFAEIVKELFVLRV